MTSTSAQAASAIPGGLSGQPLIRIRPARGWVSLELRELWHYRELLFFLAWRDIKVRYKQTGLGIAWAVLQPLLTMLVFTFLFGRVAKMPSQGIPYPLFALSGLVPWTLFSRALTDSSNSVVASQSLITKVYFPRLVIPLAAVLAGVVDFVIALGMLAGLLAYYHVVPGSGTILLPLFVVLAMVSAFAVGLWLSALNVMYRDVRYAVPFLAQLWLFLTPIAYPSSEITNPFWRVIYGLNPMAGVVEGFRWALVGTPAPTAMVMVSSVAVVVLLISGLFYFRRMERVFADVV